MKSAIYFEDGLTQVVLTPESQQEKAALALLDPSARVRLEVKRGQFVDDAHGYKRHAFAPIGYMSASSSEPLKSTILVIRPQAEFIDVARAELARTEHRNRGE